MNAPATFSGSKPGYRILPCTKTLPAGAADAVRKVPTPNISDSMGKVSPAGTGLRPMHRQGSMAGRAITVRVPPGDNLMAYKAILDAQPGDVIVIDAGGVIEQAIIGEIMTTWAASRGIAGMVVYGAVRDVDILGAADFPVYASGFTHRGPYKDGPGELNIPISIGGMMVSPGDLVVGDANGVVVIPHDDIAATVESAQAIQRREDALVREIQAGKYDSAWVDEALRTRGYA